MLSIQYGNMQEGDSSRNNISYQNFGFYPYQNIGRKSSKLHVVSKKDPAQTTWLVQTQSGSAQNTQDVHWHYPVHS